MWVKNIIPNVLWIDGDIYTPAPSPLKLGYHQSVDADYLLQTTRELPKCSALGYGLDQAPLLFRVSHPTLPRSLSSFSFQEGVSLLSSYISRAPSWPL